MTKTILSRFLVMVIVAFALLGAIAHAGRITVENTTNVTILMAFKFYDYARKDWVVCGWYSVPARETKYWNFNVAPDRKIYWYGKTHDGKRHWPGQGDHGQSIIYKQMSCIKATSLKTYADAKVVQFRTRDPDGDGNLRITLSW